MENHPRTSMISVIVPLWNPWEATEKLWKSLQKQTVPFELIIEDGSNGAQVARNRGAAKATGQYLFFCDQDIELEPRCLELLLKALQANPTAGYAYCDYDRRGAITGRHRAIPFDAQRLRTRNYISTSSLLRRSLFPGFDESIGRLQDWDLWLTILNRGIIGIYIPRMLFTAYYREGDVSTRGDKDYQHWHKIIQEKHQVNVSAGLVLQVNPRLT